MRGLPASNNTFRQAEENQAYQNSDYSSQFTSSKTSKASAHGNRKSKKKKNQSYDRVQAEADRHIRMKQGQIINNYFEQISPMETNLSNYNNSIVTNKNPITRHGSALEDESQLKSTQGVISKSSKTFTQDNAYADRNFRKNANFENEIDINNIESAAQDIAQEDLKNGRQ